MIQIVVALMIAVTAFLAGVSVEGNRRDAKELKIVQKAKAEKERIEAIWRGKEAKLSADIEQERVRRSDDRRKFNKRLKEAENAGTLATCSQEPVGAGIARPAPRVVFGDTFVGLWDDALKVGLPAAIGATGADGADQGAGVVAAESLLDNHAENAERCNEARSIAFGWQRFAREHGLVKDEHLTGAVKSSSICAGHCP